MVSNISPFYGFSIAITKIGLKKEVGIDMRMFGIVKIALVSKIKKETGSVKILIFSFHDGHLVGRETVVALIGGKVPWHHQSCVGEVHPLL